MSNPDWNSEDVQNLAARTVFPTVCPHTSTREERHRRKNGVLVQSICTLCSGLVEQRAE